MNRNWTHSQNYVPFTIWPFILALSATLTFKKFYNMTLEVTFASGDAAFEAKGGLKFLRTYMVSSLGFRCGEA